MNVRDAILILSMIPVAGSLSEMVGSQSVAIGLEATPASSSVVASPGPVSIYARPTPGQRIGGYGLMTFGPIPILESAGSAGIDQFENSPPEWKQGVEGFGKRFASDFGTATVATTTRYGLSEVFREDSLYYPCDCTGIFPRVGHAAISAVTARRGADGHRAFSLSGLVAPYAGSTVAVYGWYPSRFGAEDAFRMGNYRLMTGVFGNIATEFFGTLPHSLFHRRYMDNEYASPDPGSKQ
jgi:hypothetical protein